ncbi:hypothetical protein [Hungatella hathewayi]|uniref:hypothetical protein n=1 Tax=Hungatella hathewayi TaxID=154046 RepID=UPI00356A4CBB
MRLLVLENSALKEKARLALEKEKRGLDPAIKALEKKVFRCEADVEEELKRFGREKGLKLFECACHGNGDKGKGRGM